MSIKETAHRIRMRLTPPSSRSFQRATGHLMRQSAETLDSIHSVEQRLTVLESTLQSVAYDVAVSDERARLRFNALYSEEGEDAEHAKRRFFASIPPATGAKRLMQLANARLMSEFDTLCQKAGVEYWFSYGTLIAALSRSGFIPWDDDIDLCMMREDVAVLATELRDNPNYHLTLVYDWYSPCRQIRFSSRDPLVPCFVDVSLYDWACDASRAHDDGLRSLRLELMESVRSGTFDSPYWKERGWLLAPDSGEVVQSSAVDFSAQDAALTAGESDAIEQFFTSYQARAYEMGILCDKNEAHGVAYALDNTYDAPWRRIIWPKDMIFPTHKHAFESYQFSVPCDESAVADECYPGWPYLPSDMLAHDHFSKDLLANGDVLDALSEFVGKDER